MNWESTSIHHLDHIIFNAFSLPPRELNWLKSEWFNWMASRRAHSGLNAMRCRKQFSLGVPNARECVAEAWQQYNGASHNGLYVLFKFKWWQRQIRCGKMPFSSISFDVIMFIVETFSIGYSILQIRNVLRWRGLINCVYFQKNMVWCRRRRCLTWGIRLRCDVVDFEGMNINTNSSLYWFSAPIRHLFAERKIFLVWLSIEYI